MIKFILVAFFAIIASLGFSNILVPFGIPFFCLIGTSAFFFFLQKEERFKQKVLLLLDFSLVAFFVSYYWLFYTLHHFGEIPIIGSFLIGLLVAIFLFPNMIIFLFFDRCKMRQKEILGSILLTLLDRLIYPLFPFSLGDTFLNIRPFLYFAPIFGAIGYTFIFYYIVLKVSKFLRNKKFYYTDLIFLGAFIIISLINPLETNHLGTPTKINLVQGNINNVVFLKDAGLSGREDIVKRYQGLSLSSDLVVWPENAYPFTVSSFDNVKNLLSSSTKLVTGSSRIEGHNFYNSIISSDGEFYDKRILVPFGEYFPIFSKYLEEIFSMSPFTKGSVFTSFKLNNGETFIAAICYEILFSNYIRKYIRSVTPPSFIVNISNDDWYGFTSQRYQHRYLAHWRSLEFNLPIIRVTNTGLSQVLYPDGSLSKDLGIDKEGSVETILDYKYKETLFTKYGILNLIVLILMLLGSLSLETFLKKVVKSKQS